MHEFPDITKNDYYKGVESKDGLDIAIIAHNIYRDRRAAVRSYNKLANDHSGIKSSNESDNIIKKTGNPSATKYEKFTLGRTKIRRLLGEFLKMGLDTTVYVMNKEAINAKIDKYLDVLTLSLVKPQIESVRERGIPAYKGVQIPSTDNEEFWDAKRFKLEAEIIMQTLIDRCRYDEKLDMKLYNALEHFLVGAEAHCKVERKPDMTDTIRGISPSNAIFIEYEDDNFADQTPLKGEIRKMNYSDILQEFANIEDIKEKLKSVSYGSEDSENRSTNIYDKYYRYDVIYVQTKSFDPFFIKTIKDSKGFSKTFELSKKEYLLNKSQITFDVKNNKYTIEKMYRPSIYEIVYIIGANDWLLQCKKTESTVLTEGKDGLYYPEYDYKSILMPKIGNERISLQHITSKIERVIDQTMFAIRKELSKPGGSALGMNGGALPKNKKFTDLFHQIDETGAFTFETTGERNSSGEDLTAKDLFISANLGSPDRLRFLLEIKKNLEVTLDSVTGMNDAREGFTKATATATASQSDLEASRTATYEIFFLFGMFSRNVITHLINKKKSNPHNFNDESLLFGDNEMHFMKMTSDLILYDYGGIITDGRRESEIITKIEQFFPFELNASTLRSEDVVKFFQAESLGKAVRSLETSRKELQKIKDAEAQRNNEQITIQEQGKQKLASGDQANELDKIVLKGKVTQEVDDNKAENQSLLDEQGQNKDIAIKESEQRLAKQSPDGKLGSPVDEFAELPMV